jgi:hypothetical protein
MPTISVDTVIPTLGAVAAANEALTINSGATYTIDRPTRLAAGGETYWGTRTINNGRILVDGRNIFRVQLASTASFAVNQTLTSGSVSATIVEVSGLFVQYVTTGTNAIANGATVTSSGGGNTTAAADSEIGHFHVWLNDNTLDTILGLGTWQIRGQWKTIGTSNGSASQTFTSWTGALHSGVQVETASGSGVYELWCNINTLALTAVGSVGEHGKFFKQTLNSTTLTFGNGTNGAIPASGCRIRVPNVAITATTAAAFGGASPWISASNYANRARSATSSGGAIDFQNALFSGYFIEMVAPSLVSIDGILSCVIRTFAATAVTISNSCIGNDSTTLINTALLTSSIVTVSNCSFWMISTGTANVSISISGTTSTFTNCKSTVYNRSNVGDDCVSFARSAVFNFTNFTAIGARIGITGGSGGTMDTVYFSDNVIGVDSTVNSINGFLITSASNVVVKNLIPLAGFAGYRGFLFEIQNNTNNLIIANMGTVTSPVVSNNTTRLMNLASEQGLIRISKVYFVTSRSSAYYTSSVGNTGIGSLELSQCNVDSAYASTLPTTTTKKAVFLGIKASTIPSSFSSCSGLVWYALFTSATAGAVGVFFNFATSDQGFELIAGTQKFDGVGTLNFANGDQVRYTSPAQPFLGYTALSTATIGGTGTGNLAITYRLDTGNGFSGSYKTFDNTNLAAETISATEGFRIQFEITATGTATLNQLRAVATTTSVVQNAVNYPINSTVLLSITNAVENAHCVIIRQSDGKRLLDALADSTGKASTSYQYDTSLVDVPVIVRVRLKGYTPYELYTAITPTGLTVPAAFPVDGNTI